MAHRVSSSSLPKALVIVICISLGYFFIAQYYQTVDLSKQVQTLKEIEEDSNKQITSLKKQVAELNSQSSNNNNDDISNQISLLKELEEDSNKQITSLKQLISELSAKIESSAKTEPSQQQNNNPTVKVDTNFFADIHGFNVSVWTDKAGLKEAQYIVREFQRDTYNIKDLKLEDGDVVVEFGGNIGLFSVMIGLLNPGIKIYSLEPVPNNYAKLLKNIKANGISDRVVAINKAVTKDGRPITLMFNPELNGETINADITDNKRPAFMENAIKVEVQSTTLPDLFRDYSIKEVALMKIDCEGCEYEVVPNMVGLLDRVHRFVTEIHKNPYQITQEQVDEVIAILKPKAINDFLADH